jgi:hypothetical protein
MENTPEPQIVRDEVKRLWMAFVILFGLLCFLLLCTTGGLYGGILVIEEKQKQVAIAQSTLVAGYHFFDDFHDNRNEWMVGSESNDFWDGTYAIEDGMYVWNIDEFHEDGRFVSWREHGNKLYLLYFRDFDMSVDAKLGTPEADLCYGLVFRESDVGSYMFHVCDGQQFAVTYNEYGTEHDELIQPWKYTRAIRSGDWNTLAVSARGDHFVLSINNQVVFEFTDTRLTRGKVYLLLDSYAAIPGTIMFDNFGVQQK